MEIQVLISSIWKAINETSQPCACLYLKAGWQGKLCAGIKAAKLVSAPCRSFIELDAEIRRAPIGRDSSPRKEEILQGVFRRERLRADSQNKPHRFWAYMRRLLIHAATNCLLSLYWYLTLAN